MTPIVLALLLGGAPVTDLNRSLFEKGKGDPFVFFVVFGNVNTKAPLSMSKYRISAPSKELSPMVLPPERCREFHELLKFGKAPKAAEAAKAATACVVLTGTVKDPPALDYLRDAAGMVQWMLDNGGVAALNVQTFTYYSLADFNKLVFSSERPAITEQVVLLWSDEAEKGSSWLHTRGMRTFGRPDLSLRGVTAAMRKDAEEAFQRFIGMHAQGGWIPEGQTLKLGSLTGLVAHHRGSVDDPDFNNVHVAFEKK